MNTTNPEIADENKQKRSTWSRFCSRLIHSSDKTNSSSHPPVSINEAKCIMQNNIVLPEEVEEKLKISYSPEDIKSLSESLPSREELSNLKSNDFILVPVPPQPLTFKVIFKECAELSSLVLSHGSWLEYLSEIIGIQSPNKERWIPIIPYNIPESYNATFREQIGLIYNKGDKTTSIPKAIEVCWFSIVCKVTRGIVPWEGHIMTRTLSSRWDGYHVCISCESSTSKNGAPSFSVHLYNRADTDRNPRIGVTIKYKYHR